jgi:uncharacterized protein YjbI with pentapeptide repeats
VEDHVSSAQEGGDAGVGKGVSALPPEPSPSRGPPVAEPRDPTTEELESTLSAVADAAAVSAGLWLSYLFVAFYLLIALGSITHRDLFFANPVKLPFLGSIELPLEGFFWLGPAIFLVIHAYVLLHFALLASKAGAYDRQLRALVASADARAMLRRRLPINIFVQFLAGPDEVRRGAMGLMLRLIAWISLVIGPVALLVFYELQFLPYQDVWISWWQRIAVGIDIVLLWALWPAILHGEVVRRGRRRIRSGVGMVLGGISLVAILLVMAIGTVRGEWLDVTLSGFPLRSALIAGKLDPVARRPTSLWSNRLVLPRLDAVDRTRFDSAAKIAAAHETASLRGRHLAGAILDGADLEKIDFTGADLKAAELVGAQLSAATLDKADLRRANLAQARLQGASLDGVFLQGAELQFAQFQGASLRAARLPGADLLGANLRAADLEGAELLVARLRGANLEVAKLEGAQLVGADLSHARLLAADLMGANLQVGALTDADLRAAALDGAQLQGAMLDFVHLQGASLYDAYVWRADLATTADDLQDVWTWGIETRPLAKCPAGGICPWGLPALSNLKQLIVRDVPATDDRGRVLARLSRTLDPTRQESPAGWNPQVWTHLQPTRTGAVATPEEAARLRRHDEALFAAWREIGCAPDGAPFVLASLARRLNGSFSGALAPRLAAEFLSADCAGGRDMTEATRRILTSEAARKNGRQGLGVIYPSDDIFPLEGVIKVAPSYER